MKHLHDQSRVFYKPAAIVQRQRFGTTLEFLRELGAMVAYLWAYCVPARLRIRWRRLNGALQASNAQSSPVGKSGTPLTNTPDVRPVRRSHYAEVPSWLQILHSVDLPRDIPAPYRE